jgi:hypothetical protein
MKANYFQEPPTSPVELDVLAENADGTYNLGRGDVLVVSQCPVGDKPGHCRPVVAAAAVEPEKTEGENSEEGTGELETAAEEEPNKPKKKTK